MKQYSSFLTLLVLFFLLGSCTNKSKQKNEQHETASAKEVTKTISDLKIDVQPVQKHSVLKEADFNVWGASMVRTDDGTCHLFYARWPKETGFRGWLKNSDIAYATASSPEGPYTFQRVALTGFGAGNWNQEAAHNPHIKKFGDKYYLYFISHRKKDLGLSDWMNHIFTQRIGVAVADHPAGPWTVLPEPLIDYQEGKPAHGYMVNPSVCQKPDGTYLMMFKARRPGAETSGKFDPIHCLATAPTPAGPFTIAEQTLLTEATAEDPFVWYQKDRYYAIVKDMHAHYTGHRSLALFESPNGLDWNPSKNILVCKAEIFWEDSSITELKNLDRPQLWFDENGKPAMLFCAVRLKQTEDNKGKTTYNVHIPIITK